MTVPVGVLFLLALSHSICDAVFNNQQTANFSLGNVCEFRIKNLRNEDSVMRTIRNRRKAQVHWDQLRKYVMYTWNCKALDDYYESTNNRSGCTGFNTRPILRNGTVPKRMQREADTISFSFNRKLSLHNKKTVVQECVDTVGDVKLCTSGTRVNPPESSSRTGTKIGHHLQSESLAPTTNEKQQRVALCQQDSSLPKASSLTIDDIIPPPPSLELKDPAQMDMSDVQKNLRSLYEYNVLLREKLVQAQSLFHSLATKSSTEGQT